MQPHQSKFLFLNMGHFLVHLFMLIFATVAAVRLNTEWEMGYAELIPYSVPGLIAYGVCAVPAGWAADQWSREGMMAIFFIGTGISSIVTGLAESPLEISIALTMVGAFAAIYHPVGLAMVVQGQKKTGVRLAINGVFGNMGVATAALVTGFLIDVLSWRSTFYLPGALSVVIGLLYLAFEYNGQQNVALKPANQHTDNAKQRQTPNHLLPQVFFSILLITALSGLVFQSTTFALPKILSERLGALAGTATLVGFYTSIVFAIAAFAQLLVGYLIDQHSLRRIFLWTSFVQIVLFVAMIRLTGIPAFLGSIAFMLLVFGQIPILDVLIGRVVKSEWHSRAYALSYLVNFTVSAAAVPMIAWIYEGWAFDMLFILLAGFACLTWLAVLFLPR